MNASVVVAMIVVVLGLLQRPINTIAFVPSTSNNVSFNNDKTTIILKKKTTTAARELQVMVATTRARCNQKALL